MTDAMSDAEVMGGLIATIGKVVKEKQPAAWRQVKLIADSGDPDEMMHVIAFVGDRMSREGKIELCKQFFAALGVDDLVQEGLDAAEGEG